MIRYQIVFEKIKTNNFKKSRPKIFSKKSRPKIVSKNHNKKYLLGDGVHFQHPYNLQILSRKLQKIFYFNKVETRHIVMIFCVLSTNFCVLVRKLISASIFKNGFEVSMFVYQWSLEKIIFFKWGAKMQNMIILFW